MQVRYAVGKLFVESDIRAATIHGICDVEGKVI